MSPAYLPRSHPRCSEAPPFHRSRFQALPPQGTDNDARHRPSTRFLTLLSTRRRCLVVHVHGRLSAPEGRVVVENGAEADGTALVAALEIDLDMLIHKEHQAAAHVARQRRYENTCVGALKQRLGLFALHWMSVLVWGERDQLGYRACHRTDCNIRHDHGPRHKDVHTIDLESLYIRVLHGVPDQSSFVRGLVSHHKEVWYRNLRPLIWKLLRLFHQRQKKSSCSITRPVVQVVRRNCTPSRWSCLAASYHSQDICRSQREPEAWVCGGSTSPTSFKVLTVLEVLLVFAYTPAALFITLRKWPDKDSVNHASPGMCIFLFVACIFTTISFVLEAFGADFVRFSPYILVPIPFVIWFDSRHGIIFAPSYAATFALGLMATPVTIMGFFRDMRNRLMQVCLEAEAYDLSRPFVLLMVAISMHCTFLLAMEISQRAFGPRRRVLYASVFRIMGDVFSALVFADIEPFTASFFVLVAFKFCMRVGLDLDLQVSFSAYLQRRCSRIGCCRGPTARSTLEAEHDVDKSVFAFADTFQIAEFSLFAEGTALSVVCCSFCLRFMSYPCTFRARASRTAPPTSRFSSLSYFLDFICARTRPPWLSRAIFSSG